MAKMAQTWNNVISYIKIKLGVPVNSIELTDDQMIEFLEEHILQRFSEEFPVNKWVHLDSSARVSQDTSLPDNQGASHIEFSYKLPTDDINVESVHEVFHATNGALGAVSAGAGAVWNSNPIDQLLQNGYNQINGELAY